MIRRIRVRKISHLNPKAPRTVTYRPFDDFDIETFNCASSITPCDSVLEYSDVDDIAKCFEYLKWVCSIVLFERTRTFRIAPTLWITDSTRAVILDRDMACLRAKSFAYIGNNIYF